MTDVQRVAAMSMNLLRISEWYYKNPRQNAALCQRHFEQALALGAPVRTPAAQPYLQQLRQLSFQPGPESSTHCAERFLTFGVLLQHPERWMK
jgi:hypothetical protein